jgi:eukaryotic-like serine/threonine-protein kinase
MAAYPRVDRETFLAYVLRSGLLTEDQLAEAGDQFPDTERGRPVARALVAAGLLTRFQAQQLLAGRTSGFFLGQYRILDQIGQGGMGRVFKAEHRTLGRLVAIKVLAPRLLKTARAQELFRRELRAAGLLMHPNIVTAFDANHEGQRTYLVMECVDGPNLHQLVKRHGPLPVGVACEYVRQVAQGLHYAHQKGMVHRDIKPANLLLQTESLIGPGGQAVVTPTVKISDFGLARLTGPKSNPGGEPGSEPRRNVLMGTPDYVAPEQARDTHGADGRSDLYSLGCTFFHLLTGRVPFPGGGPLDKLVRHTTEEVPAIERLRPEVPPQVAGLVRRLMAKRPEDRFQTAAELATALTPFCGTALLADPIRPPSSPFLDGLTTPAGGSACGVPVDPAAVDDGSALAGTVMPESSATPLGSTRLPLPPPVECAPPASRRGWWAVALLAAALLASLLAAGAAGWLLATQ